MNYHSEEENPDWNRFWSYNLCLDDPHGFGECMENWHDYEWKKEQKEMDSRREEEESMDEKSQELKYCNLSWNLLLRGMDVFSPERKRLVMSNSSLRSISE